MKLPLFVRRGAQRLRVLLEQLFFPERWDRIIIARETVHDICTLARGAAPNEMILFLTGGVQRRRDERVLLIDGLYLKSYHASTRMTSFTTSDLPLLGNVYGTVHSHPGPSNRPSQADRRLFNSFGVVHLIIAQPYSPDAIAAYDKYGTRLPSESCLIES